MPSSDNFHKVATSSMQLDSSNDSIHTSNSYVPKLLTQGVRWELGRMAGRDYQRCYQPTTPDGVGRDHFADTDVKLRMLFSVFKPHAIKKAKQSIF